MRSAARSHCIGHDAASNVPITPVAPAVSHVSQPSAAVTTAPNTLVAAPPADWSAIPSSWGVLPRKMRRVSSNLSLMEDFSLGHSRPGDYNVTHQGRSLDHPVAIGAWSSAAQSVPFSALGVRSHCGLGLRSACAMARQSG